MPTMFMKRTRDTGKVDASLSPSNAVAAAVRAALARDHRMARAVISVDYVAGLGGCVLLRGQVRTASEKHAALEVARQAAGAAIVIDHLDVRADAPRKNWTTSTMGTLQSIANHAPIPRQRVHGTGWPTWLVGS